MSTFRKKPIQIRTNLLKKYNMFTVSLDGVDTDNTVKHDYSKHANNELMLSAMVIFISHDLLTCC